jgi:hypothetical protein
MFKAALHAWIAAGAIDVLPFLFLLLVLTTSRERLLRDAAPLRRKTSFEEENARSTAAPCGGGIGACAGGG